MEKAIMGLQEIAKDGSDLSSQAFRFFMARQDQKDQNLPWPSAWELTADYFIQSDGWRALFDFDAWLTGKPLTA